MKKYIVGALAISMTVLGSVGAYAKSADNAQVMESEASADMNDLLQRSESESVEAVNEAIKSADGEVIVEIIGNVYDANGVDQDIALFMYSDGSIRDADQNVYDYLRGGKYQRNSQFYYITSDGAATSSFTGFDGNE